MRAVVTGAGGFIGSHLIRRILGDTDWDVVAVDGFRHRGVTDRLSIAIAEGDTKGTWFERGQLVVHDLSVPISPQMAHRIGHVDLIFALASGSHVDASLAGPRAFAENNVAVALTTLDYARTVIPAHLVWVSTDEVYGPAELGYAHREWDAIIPSSPYSASKAAQEALCVAWWRSFGVPVSIVNMQNVYGPMQGCEKFIPRVIAAVREGETLTIHGDAARGSGSRCWLHVDDVAAALLHVAGMDPDRLTDDVSRPARWNIAGGDRVSILDVALRVAAVMGAELKWMWSDTRPGRDRHYALAGGKLARAGWRPAIPFAAGLASTVKWTADHPEWLL